jgi:predicted metalloprotease
LLDVQEYWEGQFQAAGGTYNRTMLVLYDEGTNTGGCGFGSATAGPFYCPADEKVYIDLDFAKELATKFDAEGDFALAYVVAHEVGHHVQHVTGVSDNVRREQQQNPGNANDLSIRLELQADCFAGVWAASAWTGAVVLEAGDIEEGLLAASRVGDDWIQKNLGSGRVNPDSWTHGSSAQRQRWFTEGYESADPSACDTFAVSNP